MNIVNKESNMKNKQQLYDYVFHFNPFTENWSAIPRIKYIAYWNDDNHPEIIKNKDIDKLIKQITNNEQ